MGRHVQPAHIWSCANVKWVVAIGASVLLNAILILWGRGSFVSAILPLGVSLWIGLPLIVLSAALYSVAARRNNFRFMKICSGGVIVALVIFSTLASLPVGERLLARDMNRAKAFCEALIPRLEQSKARDGTYPRDIAAVLDRRRTPGLLQHQFYWSDGTNFTFVIGDPGTIMGGVEYDSRSKGWHSWD